MKVTGWNLRGFGRSGRKTQLKDFIKKEALDIIFLQETMRQDFTDQELRGLVNGELFSLALAPGSGPLWWYADGGESRGL
jgi:hypothetical protein